MTLEDHFNNIDQPGVSRIESDDHFSHDLDLESELLRLVRNDPFASIREMMHDLRRRSEFKTIGWWRLFKILKSRKLLTRRRRFRFMRGR